jgi:hypothetical protein
VTMNLTSIAMTQTGLEDAPGVSDVGLMRLRRRRLRQIKVVLCQRDHKIGVVVHPGTVDRGTGAEATGRVGANCVELIGAEIFGHALFLPWGSRM